MAQVRAAEIETGVWSRDTDRKTTVATLLSRIIFGSLLCLLVFAYS